MLRIKILTWKNLASLLFWDLTAVSVLLIDHFHSCFQISFSKMLLWSAKNILLMCNFVYLRLIYWGFFCQLFLLLLTLSVSQFLQPYFCFIKRAACVAKKIARCYIPLNMGICNTWELYEYSKEHVGTILTGSDSVGIVGGHSSPYFLSHSGERLKNVTISTKWRAMLL